MMSDKKKIDFTILKQNIISLLDEIDDKESRVYIQEVLGFGLESKDTTYKAIAERHGVSPRKVMSAFKSSLRLLRCKIRWPKTDAATWFFNQWSRGLDQDDLDSIYLWVARDLKPKHVSKVASFISGLIVGPRLNKIQRSIERTRLQLIEANPEVPIRSNEEMVLRITARASFPDPVNFNVKAPRRHRARATSTGQKFGKGGRHLSSRAGYGLVHFESSLERGYIEAFDTSRHVAWYQEQPIEIPYTYLGREASYFPDMMVGLIDGRAVLIEFKGLKHFCYVNTFRKAIVGRRKAFSEGWGYALLYEDGGSVIDLLGRKLPNFMVNLKIIMGSFGHINRSEFFREIRSADEKFSLKDIAALCIQNDFFIETSPWRITKIPNNYTWKMFLP